MKLFLILFSGFLMNACGCHQKTAAYDMENKLATNATNEQLSGAYTVQLLEAITVESKKITLNFNSETKTVSGFSGCNNFSGSYTENDGQLVFGTLIATEMYCKDSSKIESVFMKALSKTTTYQLNKGKLSLASKDGEVLKAEVLKKEMKVQETKSIITYTASTRGYFFEAALFENKFLVAEQRDQKKPRILKVSNEEMEVLKALIAKIDVQAISTLESPTKKRHYDGAAHARITITHDNEFYKSAGFDHGFPPKELEELVHKIVALTKTEEKE